ncbi:hypothetical protein GDO86_019480 [Hymenochirus boettgeri]|uniref:FH2 domain-containing protein n=1 Tax=Hymenochirus boettgeri TaxID=247094 RepID=A0A8T2IDJ6_9PIPI|nr:hypothetical protein GDO86_019480 [Hymenochirus boettgeri]
MDEIGAVVMVTNKTSPPPPPPPPPPPLWFSLPPPPPPPAKCNSSLCDPSLPPSHPLPIPSPSLRSGEQHRSKLRNFNWDSLPAERVLMGRNLWTCGSQHPSLQIDVSRMEELFAKREEPRKPMFNGRFKSRPHCVNSEPEVSLLDSKKIMNLGIFLKQFKRPVDVIIEDVKRGVGSNFGADKLRELQKLLPEKNEVKRIKAFKGDRRNLSESELFMVLLVEVPSYCHRLKVMILKEEFFPQLNSLKQAVEIQSAAANELVHCDELHTVIHLVLKAGNYMNAGGYAGSALGFRMGSLLKLADTKSNKPGINLMHFVAKEAERNSRSLLTFPDKLTHISQASRINSQEVENDLDNLSQTLASTRASLRDQPDLKNEMMPFLMVAEAELCVVLRSLQALRDARHALMEFFCEDESTLRMEEMCLTFSTFCARFLSAVQENQEREHAEVRKERLEKRRSIASCSTNDKDLQDVELEFLLLRIPRRVRSVRKPRPLPRTQSIDTLHLTRTIGEEPRELSSKVLSAETIMEEEDLTDLPTPTIKQGLRRPRKISSEGDGQPETPGKMNRRHTLSSLPSKGKDGLQTSITASPDVHRTVSMTQGEGSDVAQISTPHTPKINSVSDSTKTSQKGQSPASESPNSFRLGGLFQRKGSLRSPEPSHCSVGKESPKGSNETSALTTFLRHLDNVRRSPR